MTKKEDGGKQGGSHEKRDSAIAARRARLRSSLAKQTLPLDPYSQNISSSEQSHSSHNELEEETFVSKNFAPESSYNTNKIMEIQSALNRAIETAGSSSTKEPSNEQEIALLNNIDHALNSCADHLASLQKVAGKQIDELKVITDTLQNRTFADVSAGLNTLMESLTAAIEPMKAIGELVPVLDRLVSVTEAKEHSSVKTPATNEELAINLIHQLVAGNIDPLTFKAAYKAIFAEDDVTILVHRLGELLGGQQLSGELFQAAYQALQLEPAKVSTVPTTQIESVDQAYEEEASVDDSKEMKSELRNLEKEEELARQLAAKEEELESIRVQLDSQWKELVVECEELRSALQSREDILKDKESELHKKLSELAAKDSENQQLRAQMEQLRDETKAMMTDLQKQLAQQQKAQQQQAQKQEEEKSAAKVSKAQAQSLQPQPGFFDFVGTSSQTDDLFAAGAKSSPMFAHEQTPISQSEAETANVPIVEPASAKNAAPDALDGTQEIKTGEGFSTVQNVAAPRMPMSDKQANQSASFVSAVGSYGSGVRAQVFEVIVRQALAGTQWREICAVPMQSNNISPDEVEAEVKRRQALLKK